MMSKPTFSETEPETPEDNDIVLRKVHARMKAMAEYVIEIERIQHQFKQSTNEAKSKSDAMVFLEACRLRNHQVRMAEARLKS